MDRRNFLRILSGAVASVSVLEVDPERLLWTPGVRKIFLPSTAILKAEDVAVEQIRRAYEEPKIVEPAREQVKAVVNGVQASQIKRGATRYVVTIPGPNGPVRGEFDSNWNHVGGNPHVITPYGPFSFEIKEG